MFLKNLKRKYSNRKLNNFKRRNNLKTKFFSLINNKREQQKKGDLGYDDKFHGCIYMRECASLNMLRHSIR